MIFCYSIFIWIEIKRSQGKAGKAGLPWEICMWLKCLRNMHLKIGDVNECREHIGVTAQHDLAGPLACISRNLCVPQ